MPHAQAAPVLGAQVKPGDTPSAMLADRIAAAADLYRAGKVDKLLLSGVRSVVVVTQRFHTAHALFAAHRAGLEATGFAADRRASEAGGEAAGRARGGVMAGCACARRSRGSRWSATP